MSDTNAGADDIVKALLAAIDTLTRDAASVKSLASQLPSDSVPKSLPIAVRMLTDVVILLAQQAGEIPGPGDNVGKGHGTG